MPLQFACIVEGHGEVPAVPLLVRRIAERVIPEEHLHVAKPIRVSRCELVRAGEVERTVEYAARMVGGQGAILLIIDSDGDCPADLGPALLQRASATRRDLPIGVVLAHQEFEAWFLAAAESLRGHCGLPEDLCPPSDPEGIRGAKEWLSKHMPSGRRYSETEDQARLVARFDIDLAQRAASFEKCYREVARLLTEARRFY